MSDESFVPAEHIEHIIYIVRGQRVMLDQDLSYLYDVSTKRLNEQVQRNINRFPEDFAFRLTKEEWEFLRCQIGILKKEKENLRCQFGTSSLYNESESQKIKTLRSQIATSKNVSESLRSQTVISKKENRGGRRYLPYVFTEHGAVMLASVLHSERAIHMSVEVVRAPRSP